MLVRPHGFLEGEDDDDWTVSAYLSHEAKSLAQ